MMNKNITILNLAKIKLLQKKKFIIISCLALILGIFYDAFVMDLLAKELPAWIPGELSLITSLKGLWFVSLAIYLVIIIMAYNIASDETITIFPGNKTDYFLGRFLADTINLFLVIVAKTILFIIEAIVLFIITKASASFCSLSLFNVKYFFTGFITEFFAVMALYSLFVFIYTIIQKWYLPVIILSAILLVVGSWADKFSITFFTGKYIDTLLFDNISLFRYLLTLLIIFAICFLLSLLIAGSLSRWQSRAYEYANIFIGLALVLAICGIEIITVSFNGLHPGSKPETINDTTLSKNTIEGLEKQCIVLDSPANIKATEFYKSGQFYLKSPLNDNQPDKNNYIATSSANYIYVTTISKAEAASYNLSYEAEAVDATHSVLVYAHKPYNYLGKEPVTEYFKTNKDSIAMVSTPVKDFYVFDDYPDKTEYPVPGNITGILAEFYDTYRGDYIITNTNDNLTSYLSCFAFGTADRFLYEDKSIDSSKCKISETIVSMGRYYDYGLYILIVD